MHERVLALILKRKGSLFHEDMKEHGEMLRAQIAGRRVLVIGAAGSIGSAFVKQVALFKPAALHLIDLSENNLVEVVRDLRSSRLDMPEDFKTLAIGMGSVEFDAFLRAHNDYDYVVSFAALKHVRSERDPYTLMRMLHTNVLAVTRLLDQLTSSRTNKFFSVSSDKAVSPASMMGATKAFMERVMLSRSDSIPFSTARFANVAFSDGSLLYGFDNRLQKRQPISAPSDVRRYFITHEEAGQLCLLSCFLGDNRDVFFPKLDEKRDMLTFSEIACIILEARGLTPRLCSSEEEAKLIAQNLDDASCAWPCFFSESNTAGEKLYEEFYTEDDVVDTSTFHSVGVIHTPPADLSLMEGVTSTLRELEELRQSGSWDASQLTRCVQSIVPELEHNNSSLDLDHKM